MKEALSPPKRSIPFRIISQVAPPVQLPLLPRRLPYKLSVNLILISCQRSQPTSSGWLANCPTYLPLLAVNLAVWTAIVRIEMNNQEDFKICYTMTWTASE